MKVAGIDEAGRGSLIGPIVIAIFITSSPEKLGTLKDSKKLTKRQRAFLYKKLKHMGEFEVIKIWPTQIDERNINLLELESIKALLKKHKPDKVYIDAFTKDKNIFSYPGVDVIAEHKADEKYSVVAAASIIAKVIRDAEINKLKRQVGDFGSGYPSDQKTIAFVEKNMDKLEKEKIIRKKWETYKRIKEPKQKKINFDEVDNS